MPGDRGQAGDEHRTAKWETVAPGIRCREHPTRKHGVKPDRYYAIRHYVDGKRIEEGLGWASDGWTVARAKAELGRLANAKDRGTGEKSLRAEREAAEAAAEVERRRQEEANRLALEEAERRRREEITLAEFWPRYWADAVEGRNKATTRDEKRRMWETRIAPALGDRPVKDITDADISALLRSVQRFDRAGNVTHGKAEAANLYRFTRHIFNAALKWKVRPVAAGNPVKDYGTEPEVKRRERLLSDDEVSALMREIDRSWETGDEAPALCAAVALSVYLGLRASEAATLEHRFIRLDLGEIHLPDSKTGHSVRPLPPAAEAVLDRLGRVAVGSPYVFPSERNPRAALPYRTLERAARRMAARAGIESFHLHLLRHRHATIIANTESNPRVGMRLTGHKSTTAYLRYVQVDRDRARDLAAKLGDMTAALATAPAPEKVVAIRKRDGK